jgi:beta-CASP RNase J family ribonuclease
MGTSSAKKRQFPGPPPGQGPPLRILPIGGLGEIGMNCMLIGVYDRYILVDAGLMFPDFQDLGMQKILPDTSFLAEWRDRIEAVIITHGHEDHIGALPWVVPALDPGTPIYAGGFPMQLIKRRLVEYNLWDASRMHTINMREPFQAGPFQVEPFRVTHSIPDCCGLVLRSDQGTIVHTGDWKIDEDPVDGEVFDRPFFEQLGKEGVALFMSDSTNVLSPGRTTSEAVVRESLAQRVLSHQGKGRIITTQFASNLHRLASVKKAADAAGRKIAFIGMSLTMYLEAAFREGRAPFNPKELVPQSEIDNMDPNELLIVTTGSQAEPRAALSLAAREASHMLKLQSSDLILYSAKVIPGNDTRVMQMMNSISELGPEIAMGRDENLHTSGHAYKGELEEVLQYIKPQHFLPVHGEYAFLCAHAQLAREVGVNYTSVIRNGQMLGVHERINAKTVSTGSMAMLGDVALTNFYNDGNKGTGSAREMALEERQLLAVEGIVIAAIDVLRDSGGNSASSRRRESEIMMSDDGAAAAVRRSLKARIRITTRAMWIDKGRLLESMHIAAEKAIAKLPGDASLAAVERVVTDALKRSAKAFNNRRPDVVVIAHEADPRAGAAMQASRRSGTGDGGVASQGERGGRGGVAGGGGGGGDGVGYISEKEADVLLKERDSRRRQAQREKDLLFAGKGGDIGELANPADSSVSEEEGNYSISDSGSFSDEGRGTVSSKIGGGRSRLKPSPSASPAASYLDKAKQLAAKNKAVFGKGRGPPAYPLDPEVVERRKKANPRDTLPEGGNIEYP